MTPDEFTNQELLLDVGDGHQLYVHDWGNPDAKTPILFLHGGPGGGCNDGHKGYFNPAVHRVIFLDQRGSGKSLPYGSLEHNTTVDLANDINTVLDKFSISSAILCGRSWGSTLAFVYAIQNPKRVAAIITGGIMLGNAAEATHLEKTNVGELFYPDIWDAIDIPENVYELWQQVLSDNLVTSKDAAYKLAQLLGSQLRLDDRNKVIDYETFDSTSIRIEAHYKTHEWFIDENYIMNNAAKLTMPVWIIQGRYDMSCLPKFAYELSKEISNCNLLWTQAGHSGNDRENWLATKSILAQVAS